MPTYSAHGLVVDSELCLPELQCVELDEFRRGDPETDVHLRVGDVPKTPSGQEEDYKIYPVSDGHRVTVTGVGSLFATDGRELVVDPAPDANMELVHHLVIGQGFRLLLHQRGYVVLHGSATVVDGRAVIFLGESGQGKSTTVAAWYASGYSVLSDDVTAVDPETRLVKPGFPQIKLDPESASVIDSDLSPAERTADVPRRYYATLDEYRDESVPLGGLYFLTDGPEVRIEALPPSERAYRLMCASASTYHSADDERVEPHLNDCVQLASKASVKELERPREYDALPEVVRAVEADLAGSPEEDRAE